MPSKVVSIHKDILHKRTITVNLFKSFWCNEDALLQFEEVVFAVYDLKSISIYECPNVSSFEPTLFEFSFCFLLILEILFKY